MLSQVRIQRERQKTLKAVTQADMDRQEFYRGITHQLRTPLTVINGMIEQLRKFLPTDNDVAQKELQAMERKSEELLTLVREMIDFNAEPRFYADSRVVSTMTASIAVVFSKLLPTDSAEEAVLDMAVANSSVSEAVTAATLE